MKIKISNSFLLTLAFVISINGFKLFSFVILCSIIHEIGHILMLKLFKVKIHCLSISAIGGKLYIANTSHLSNIKQILIYSFGIMLNIIFGYLFYFIAINGIYSETFFILSGINFMLGCFNLLPIFSLDGFNILVPLLNIFCKSKNSNNICNITSLILNLLLFLVGIVFAFSLNFSILIISIYLICSHFRNYTNF